MYDMTKGHIFFLFALVVAVLIGYVVFLLSGVFLDGVLAVFFVFFFLIGGALFLTAETDDERLFSAFIMAFVIFVSITKSYGLQAGVVTFLISLAGFLAYILRSEE
jgi:hypothetical protein